MMMPDKHAHEVSIFFTAAALAGGLLWAMIRFTAVVGGPAPYDRTDVVKAAIDAVCALIAALISALFVSPAIVGLMRTEDTRFIGLVYLLVGLAFWQVAPWLLRWCVNTSKRFANSWSNNHVPGADAGKEDDQ